MLRTRRTLISFMRSRRGAAAAEFALILPVMLSGLAGMSELSRAIDEWRKLTLLARAVADLTSQGDAANPVDLSLMQDIFNVSPNVMRPFSTASVKIVVSAVGYDVTKFGVSPRVCSSLANANATARPVGPAGDLTLPAGYPVGGARYVLVELSVGYTPMIGAAALKALTGVGAIPLSATVPWSTRGGMSYNGNAYTEVVLPGPGADPRPCENAFKVDGTRG